MKDNDSYLKPDETAIVSDGESVTFATRKQFQRLSEAEYSSLRLYTIVGVFNVADDMFFLMRDSNPLNFGYKRPDQFKLLRFCTNDGKTVILVADLSEAEADNVLNHWLKIKVDHKGGEQEC